jgi:shikimate dehydrogenase
MNLYGLIGYPLSHSFSKKYFTEKFIKEGISDSVYELFPLEKIEDLAILIKEKNNLIGLNVTIPYKEKVLPYLHELDESAAKIGAVNTIKFIRTNNLLKLKGYNTDAYGFEQSLKPLLKAHHTHALILGTGGAAKAVEYILKKNNIQYQYVSRTAKNNILSYNLLTKEILQQYSVIINTSPLGMHPNTAEYPAIPYEYITNNHLLYDLVYNPLATTFMKKGLEKGAIVKNGLDMLHFQAEKAWEIWGDVGNK